MLTCNEHAQKTKAMGEDRDTIPSNSPNLEEKHVRSVFFATNVLKASV